MASGVSFILHCIMEKVLVEQRLESSVNILMRVNLAKV